MHLTCREAAELQDLSASIQSYRDINISRALKKFDSVWKDCPLVVVWELIQVMRFYQAVGEYLSDMIYDRIAAFMQRPHSADDEPFLSLETSVVSPAAPSIWESIAERPASFS